MNGKLFGWEVWSIWMSVSIGGERLEQLFWDNLWKVEAFCRMEQFLKAIFYFEFMQNTQNPFKMWKTTGQKAAKSHSIKRCYSAVELSKMCVKI